ncbi:TetR/AcrR family transcriptional regulator [Bradyrhizobium sediminis]|uniref:TetR/AcrR family transcriptional regulator n=1 Tax=Bradyrhizobium sediminis TaxID=2840469 RepID=A0A975NSF5_9BRAD|nr:TetR/AcrR family transcriptional regulator [Bradyrhizobium sediminis]QWG19836.1 TetR/AcrR family transcriptional regulator [Bradyrhizobium sediminis]
MARTRSENYDGIHLGILTQAAALFSAQGYMRSSIADLADACKLSRGALYHYFDSKEAILFAILDAHIREMIAHVDAAIAEGGPTLTQFRNVIRTTVEVNAKSPHEQRVLIHDLSFLNEDEQHTIKDLERQLVDTVTDLLVRLDAEGKIVKRTRKIYTMILFGIINYTYTWYDPKGGIGPREFADIAVDLFLNGFAPGDAARPAPAGRREKV